MDDKIDLEEYALKALIKDYNRQAVPLIDQEIIENLLMVEKKKEMISVDLGHVENLIPLLKSLGIFKDILEQHEYASTHMSRFAKEYEFGKIFGNRMRLTVCFDGSREDY